jgi:hypothetical protein
MTRPITKKAEEKVHRQLGIVEGRCAYIRKELLDQTRKKSPASHWSVRAWTEKITELQDLGRIKIGARTQTGTEEEKKKVRHHGTPDELKEEIAYKIRMWMEREAGRGDDGRWSITPGQAIRLTRVRRSEKHEAMDIYAILAEMAAEKEIVLQLSPYHGKGKREWQREISSRLEERGWSTTERAMEIAKAVQTFPETNRTIIELGSGWEGATDGLRSAREVDRVITVDQEPHNLGQRGTRHPEVLMRFEQAKEGELIQDVAKKAAAKLEDIIGIWASLSCIEHSTANALGVTAGIGTGVYGEKDMSEKEKAGMIAGVKGIKAWHDMDPERNHYFMENVAWGSMRDEAIVKSTLGVGDTLDGCAYGLKHQKPYRYWTSIPKSVWTPRLATQYCSACATRPKRKHEQAMCPKKGDKRPRPSIPGYTVAAAANRIPPALGKEIAEAFVEMDNKKNHM